MKLRKNLKKLLKSFTGQEQKVSQKKINKIFKKYLGKFSDDFMNERNQPIQKDK